MDVKTSPIAPTPTQDDRSLDLALRPKLFSEYVGQENIKENLRVLLGAAKQRGDPAEHILLHGPSGLGKTTLAYLIAYELGAQLKITSGTALEKAGDVGAILTGLSDGDVLFIDEVHRLNSSVEEVIYPAMENFKLDIVIGKGNAAKTLQIDLPRFTLVAATTKISALSAPFRSRFGAHYRLDFYTEADIAHIIDRSAKLLQIPLDPGAREALSVASRFTPRVANRLLKRVRDFAQVHGHSVVSTDVARSALAMLHIDERGLEETDRNILKVIHRQFQGGPVGLKSIAATLAEEESTLEEVYEPYLMRIGFLARTPKGRIITPDGKTHIEPRSS
ncbi:MAG: Holliday junction branch migration DNA helicase RuvB [Candidatus Paceibacterota bacterium]|nr:MAG: Holliday junction branch migration DNA helicase RuvB [Candidatus Paceibacterota bacterium]